jgi:hypothetical protein
LLSTIGKTAMEALTAIVQHMQRVEEAFAPLKAALRTSKELAPNMDFFSTLEERLWLEQQRLQRKELEKAQTTILGLLQPLPPTVPPPALIPFVAAASLPPSPTPLPTHDVDTPDTEAASPTETVPPKPEEDEEEQEGEGGETNLKIPLMPSPLQQWRGLFPVCLGIIDMDYFTYNPPHETSHTRSEQPRRLRIGELEACKMRPTARRWVASANAQLTKLCPVEVIDMRQIKQQVQLCIPRRTTWFNSYGDVTIMFRQADLERPIHSVREFTDWRPINVTARRLATLLAIKQNCGRVEKK